MRNSMNPVTIRLPMLWTHTNALSTSTRLTCTSKHGYSFCATTGKPRGCPISKATLYHKMYILSSIKPPVLVLLQARNGACRQEGQLRFYTAPRPYKTALHLTGAGGWQRFQILNLPPNRLACMISASQFAHRHHKDKLALAKNK